MNTHNCMLTVHIMHDGFTYYVTLYSGGNKSGWLIDGHKWAGAEKIQTIGFEFIYLLILSNFISVPGVAWALG